MIYEHKFDTGTSFSRVFPCHGWLARPLAFALLLDESSSSLKNLHSSLYLRHE